MQNFWTHGVNTVVEFPDRLSNLRHAGWGTLIEKTADVSGSGNNWFHLPLFTPGNIVAQNNSAPGETAVFNALFAYARLKASVNENAHIRELHLRAGTRLIHRENVELRGPRVDYQIDARTRLDGGYRMQDINDDGLTLCVRVTFLSGNPIGRVVFHGAGAYYSHV